MDRNRRYLREIIELKKELLSTNEKLLSATKSVVNAHTTKTTDNTYKELYLQELRKQELLLDIVRSNDPQLYKELKAVI